VVSVTRYCAFIGIVSARQTPVYMKGNHTAHGFNTNNTTPINASITRTIFTVDCILITPFFLFVSVYPCE
jgi:hypothetical protein